MLYRILHAQVGQWMEGALVDGDKFDSEEEIVRLINLGAIEPYPNAAKDKDWGTGESDKAPAPPDSHKPDPKHEPASEQPTKASEPSKPGTPPEPPAKPPEPPKPSTPALTPTPTPAPHAPTPAPQPQQPSRPNNPPNRR